MTRKTVKIRQLSRYELLRQLGQGPATRKFLAMLREPAQGTELCVLDLLHEDRAGDDDFRALFLDQAAATLDLDHPGVARTREVVADPHSCGFATEFLEGQTLATALSRIGRLRFPVDVYLHVLSRTLEALDYVHHSRDASQQRGPLVHGNVCPSNIFITYDGSVKLLATGCVDVTRALETTLGRVLVDRRYAAPEVLVGQASDPSADLYGVGVMLWEALTREPLARAADLDALATRRSQGLERGLDEVWPEASDPLIALCKRALAPDPRDRHTSAAELRAELGRYLTRACDTEAVVLSRLPALLEAPFRSEREELWRFVRTRATAVTEVARDVSPDTVAATPQHAPASGPPPRSEPDTGGHRAYSASVAPPGAARPSTRGHSWAPLLPMLTLVMVAVVAFGVLRQATRAEAPNELATGAAPRAAGPSASDRVRANAHDEGVEPDAPLRLEADAGAPTSTEPPAPSAFFDGQAPEAPEHHAGAALSADDLPSVDPVRDSLQDAIVRNARRALRRKPAKKVESVLLAPEPAFAGPAQPRSIDEADPYAQRPTQ